MSGTGYDLSTSIYSQDGRIFQIEYAQKAVENSETIVAIQCADGIILATEKILLSPLQTRHSCPRILKVARNIGMGISGRLSDGMVIYERAQQEVESYRMNFGVDIPVPILAERLANYMHAHTLYGQFRPLGAEILLTGRENGKNHLFKIDLAGGCRGYFGVTSGKGQQVAKSWLEKVDRQQSVRNAFPVLTKALVSAHEEFKEKTWVLEVGWISDETQGEWKSLEDQRVDELRKNAEEELDL